MNQHYKVGDTVLIDKNMKLYGPEQIPFGTTTEMVAFKGRIATITSVRVDAYKVDRYPDKNLLDGCSYRIDLDRER